ncbi:MAG TPA: tetratricopeptide repeat protein [Pyrinomonadaceae bacterium]|nr:tetratricopeptide repeat protein [Pyrinomonadaceae bacterium]
MTPAGKLAAAEARSRFALEVLRRGEEIDLARAALFVAAEDDAGCDVRATLDALNELGAQARERVEVDESRAVEALNQYLFEDLGFGGDESNYYDPRNSFLNRVVERRAGIPITLSIVYMEVGRRAGLAVEGVGMPGHFIVRARGPLDDADLLVDPFAGRVVDEDDCQQRLDMIYAGQLPLSQELLRAMPKRDILVRLLNNLKGIYVEAQMHGRALAVVERLLLLAPHAASERRDRGLLLAQLKRLPEAIADVRAYLASAANSPDAEEVREQLGKMRQRLASLN